MHRRVRQPRAACEHRVGRGPVLALQHVQANKGRSAKACEEADHGTGEWTLRVSQDLVLLETHHWARNAGRMPDKPGSVRGSSPYVSRARTQCGECATSAHAEPARGMHRPHRRGWR